MTIDRWITDAAARAPGKPALVFGGETLSYADLAARIDARAGALRRAGVGRGDRIAWYGLNHAEVFVLLFACARLGAMLVPLNWRLAEAEVATIVANCAPRCVLHDDHFAEAAGRLGGVQVLHWTDPLPERPEAAVDGDEGDPLLLVYTSGSTGLPKGAVLTQKALLANARMSVDCHGLTAEDAVLNALPMFHVGGLNILPTPAFSVGATVHLHARFEPEAVVRDLQHVQHAITVPTVMQAILAADGWAKADLSRLKALSIGSTDVPVALIDAVHGRGVPVVQVYGATETSPFAIYQKVPEAMATVGSLGRVGCACQVRLVRADGSDAPDGTPGEIWVKGDNVLAEYWRDPDLTAASLRDGWFRTGDVATRDADGLYWFADRIKHVVISGGENIYPAEVERVLRTHPGIAEVAVVGWPDPKWGEVPVAVVVAQGDLGAAEVMHHLKDRIARYKQPKDVIFVEALPRNAMGKVVARKVQELIADRASQAMERMP